MIVIKKAVWREDLIASIDIFDSEILVFPVGCSECIRYAYKTEAEAIDVYNSVVPRWREKIEGPHGGRMPK